jgi:hypothetical protein
MPKADAHNITKSDPRRTSATSNSLPDPVLTIALRVGELWDAHAAAQNREFDKRDDEVKSDEISDQINELREIALVSRRVVSSCSCA